MSARIAYEFGAFRFEPFNARLVHGQQVISLTGKATDTLLTLVSRPDVLVSKDDLMTAVWPGLAVEENNLNQQISALRKILSQDGGTKFIETVPRRGYRFVGVVRIVETSRPAADDVDVTGHDSPSVSAEAPVLTLADRALVPGPPGGPLAGSSPRLRAGLIAGLFGVVLLGPTVGERWKAREPLKAVSSSITSVAVLPFVVQNAREGGLEYLGVSLSDSLTSRLGAIRGVSVRPIVATQSFAEPNRNVLAVGRRLAVDAIVDGRVQVRGERVRVTAQLVATPHGSVLWETTVDGQTNDVFGLQDRLAGETLRAVAALNGGKPPANRTASHVAPQVQLAYLRGRYFWNKRDARGFLAARAEFEGAIALDPSFALGYAGLADTLMFTGQYAAAIEAARRAIELDPALAEPRATLAYLEGALNWNWREAERQFLEALSLNPSYATAHQWYAFHLVAGKRFDEALRQITTAESLSPASAIIVTDVGHIRFLCGDFVGAEKACRRALAMDPDFEMAHCRLGEALVLQGRIEEGIAELQRAAQRQVAAAYALAGRRDEAQSLRARIEQRSHPGAAVAYFLAMIDLASGERDKALEMLERSADGREADFYLIGVEPWFAALRGDPRFERLYGRLGFTPSTGR